MREIERQIIEAIKEKREFRHGHSLNVPYRDYTFRYGDKMLYSLHGSVLFGVSDQEFVVPFISHAHRTRTTKSRLCALLRAFNLPTIAQRDFSWYWSDGIEVIGPRTFPRNQKSQLLLF